MDDQTDSASPFQAEPIMSLAQLREATDAASAENAAQLATKEADWRQHADAYAEQSATWVSDPKVSRYLSFKSPRRIHLLCNGTPNSWHRSGHYVTLHEGRHGVIELRPGIAAVPLASNLAPHVAPKALAAYFAGDLDEMPWFLKMSVAGDIAEAEYGRFYDWFCHECGTTNHKWAGDLLAAAAEAVAKPRKAANGEYEARVRRTDSATR